MDAAALANVSQAEPALAATFKKIGHQPIVEQCVGCAHIRALGADYYCKTWAEPEEKWGLGICNFATHAKVQSVEAAKRINPLKASKRAMSGK